MALWWKEGVLDRTAEGIRSYFCGSPGRSGLSDPSVLIATALPPSNNIASFHIVTQNSPLSSDCFCTENDQHWLYVARLQSYGYSIGHTDKHNSPVDHRFC